MRPRLTIAEFGGRKFGRLTVIADAGFKKHRHFWLCRCDCGNQKTVVHDHLRAGHIRSCGCLAVERHKTAPLIRGHSSHDKKSPTYRSWVAMVTRCTNNRRKYWKNYGGRGIQVCDRWRRFENFLADMGTRPENRSLDRYPNPDGNYEPSNCRWATRVQQANNRSKLGASAAMRG